MFVQNWNQSPLEYNTKEDSTSANFDINLFRDYTGLRSLTRSSKLRHYSEDSISDELQLDANGQLDLDSPKSVSTNTTVLSEHATLVLIVGKH